MTLKPKPFLKLIIKKGWTYEDLNGVVKGFMEIHSTNTLFLHSTRAHNKKIYIAIERKNATVIDFITENEIIAKSDRNNYYCLAFPLLNLLSD